MILTISRHSDGKAFLKPTILAAIPIQSYHEALSVSQTAVLDLLLNASPKEALENFDLITRILDDILSLLTLHPSHEVTP